MQNASSSFFLDIVDVQSSDKTFADCEDKQLQEMALYVLAKREQVYLLIRTF